MNEIKITALEIYAKHGVHDYEKENPQPFVFDVVLGLDFYQAFEEDDLEKTVNYSSVCTLIKEVAETNCFDLIEKLAYECAYAVMEKFPKVQYVNIELSKPSAPIKQKFGNVSVRCEVKRREVFLSMGSSEGDKEAQFRSAISALDGVLGIKVKKVSSFIETAPYGGVAKNTFLNCAVEIECLLPCEKLLSVLHEIEKNHGRVRKERWGDRTLDIDIVFFGNEIIRERGLSVPHPDYANRSFVLEPLKEIAPDMVCPLTGKRLSDL